MYYDFEYNNIIDYWSKQFNVFVKTEDRESIIKMYEVNSQLTENSEVDFSHVCYHVIMHNYCVMKYPTLNLYESVFSKHALN